MSTKFPLCAILLELSEQLDARGSWLRLAWSPRDQNQEADALTNGHYHDFAPDNRIDLDPSPMGWMVLDEMLAAGGSMVEELARIREAKKLERAAAKERKKKRRKVARESLKEREPW